MGKDEQKEEREVLESIFPDEITDVSETEYRVQIQLDVSQGGDEDVTNRAIQSTILNAGSILTDLKQPSSSRYSIQKHIPMKHLG